ncbi:CvfB family protein [Enterococcus sp. JM9B]|uniref:CvfB family protein n=1 Tax=Enterococcus sp. JM9B TaxID=1857216 RepID=UPI001374C346|nr:S1-like domain-containing RNA-binding protein [Enterococcus sp. JM9B]KAF1304217.1 DNA-binding protein [Enterococcus sp. JM9B]
MEELLASVFSGMIIDENEKDYFVQKNGVTFRLSKKEGEFQLGTAVEGFGYQNQKQEFSFTTEIPKSRKGHYAFATVIDTRRDLGAFVDIGLPDKDIPVSLDELPTMRELWPKKGDRLMVSLRVDHKERIWATLADEKIFRALSKQGNAEMKNQNKVGTIFRLKLAGSYLLTEDFYLGFIHPSERFQEPRLGEVVQPRIIGVRPDGVLNMSLKPRAHEAINDDAAMLLAYLERTAGKRMPYTDKSDPEAIKQMFGISKGQFKRAMGHLLKAKLVEQKEAYTYLLKNSN